MVIKTVFDMFNSDRTFPFPSPKEPGTQRKNAAPAAFIYQDSTWSYISTLSVAGIVYSGTTFSAL